MMTHEEYLELCDEALDAYLDLRLHPETLAEDLRTIRYRYTTDTDALVKARIRQYGRVNEDDGA